MLDMVLDSYQKLGSKVPRLASYSKESVDMPAMRICLAFMYHDLLRFHLGILRLLKEQSMSAKRLS